MLLSDYHDHIYWPQALNRLRPSTLVGYANTWRLHIEPRWGSVELAEIEPHAIEWWLSRVPTNPLRKKLRDALRRVLRRAVHDGYLASDPFVRVDAPPSPQPDPDALSPSELRRLLRGYWDHPLEAWLLVSVCCGLRREEACALKWSDIDLRSGEIQIRETLQMVGGHLVWGEPKTPRSRRSVFLPRFAVERLRQIRGRGYLTSGMDEPLSPDAVRKRHWRHCKGRGLPYVPPKDLRHTWATIARDSGVDGTIIAAMLGHSDMSVTYRYYLKRPHKALVEAQRKVQHYIME